MNINYSNFNGTTKYHDTKTPYITFKKLDEIDFINHGFSTRLGGVSTGIYSSMNLTFTRDDNPECVSENFRIIGNALNIRPEDMVYAMQTHTANVMEVNESHKGMGVTIDRNFSDIDGLVTNIPGVALLTSYADCVPLFFVDPVNKAIGLSHSGWRGTVNNIAGNTINKMAALYNSEPTDIIAFIGPSICCDCYEVSEDVAEEFAKAYGDKVFDDILYVKDNGKFKLDLWNANYHNFLNSGLKPENIGITDICTCCNKDLLFSHRATKGKRGGLCGFLQIKE